MVVDGVEGVELAPKEMGAGIAASPHCAERRICRCSWAWSIEPGGLPTRSRSWLTSSGVASHPTAPSVRRSQINLLDCAARRFAGRSTVPARLS